MLDLSSQPYDKLGIMAKAQDEALFEETKRRTLDQNPDPELVRSYEKASWTFLYYISDFHLRHLTAVRAAMENKLSGRLTCSQ